jgi:PAS domain S-box-containing protein
MIDQRTGELRAFRQLTENANEGIWLFDTQSRMAYVNAAEARIHGYERAEDMIGLRTADVVALESLDYVQENVPLMLSKGWRGELQLIRKDGSQFPAEVTGFGITDEKTGSVVTAGITRDITARKQAEAERQRAQEENLRLQREVIEAQQLALQELSTPIIPVMETPRGGIIVIPLIGSIDSKRAKDITRTLLAGIQRHRAKVAILDITGVAIVDSGVANHLNKTIQAARLKGAHTIITGVSDAVAETIVDLGIDWSNIDTLNDLQTGLVVAMNSLGIKLMR